MVGLQRVISRHRDSRGKGAAVEHRRALGRIRGGSRNRRTTPGVTVPRRTRPARRRCAPATAPRRRTWRPSRACSARCCCPRTRSPTSSRRCAASTSTGPAHEIIYDAIIDLYGRGEPADPVTVAAELQRRGELQRVGGAPYLHTLSANVPIAANAGYYAEIVREKAILRRLVDAGTRIVQIGYAGEGEVDDIVDQAQAEVYKVTDRRTSEDYAPLSRHHGRRPRRDRGDRQPRGRAVRRADRLRRPRRPDQRSARRPDDHRRRPTRHGQAVKVEAVTPGRLACRCAACRSTTTSTSTSPARTGSRRTTRRWPWTCAGRRRSTTT